MHEAEPTFRYQFVHVGWPPAFDLKPTGISSGFFLDIEGYLGIVPFRLVFYFCVLGKQGWAQTPSLSKEH